MAESAAPKVFAPLKYECSFDGCDLQFRRKDRCESHEYTHTNQRKFKCNEPNCDRAYITNCHLRRHKRQAHEKSAEPIPCIDESCNNFFTSLEQMKQHCRTIHSMKPSARQFECDQCSEKFRRKTHLKKHLFAEHTQNYRYNCAKCGKGYLLDSQLKRHEKISHKTHTCVLCSVTFEKWSLLLAHKQREHASTEFKCTICDKLFNSRRCLNQHRVTHVSEDERIEVPCTFDGCDKTFHRRSNMLAHYKLKHENRKFDCTYDGCHLKLSTKQKLEQHIRVIHLGEMGQKKRKTKSKSEIVRRKDTGVQKTSTASKLFQVILPPEFEKAIIAGHGQNIQIEYDRINDETDEEDDRQANEANELDKEEKEKNNEPSDNDQFVSLTMISSAGAVKC